LQALASRSTGALPEHLLALATDKGNRVRSALLELLTSRPDPAHVDALITLAADDWGSESGYYGEDASYPIASGAAALLLASQNLPHRLLDKLLEIASSTNDSDVRGKLLAATAKNGGSDGRTRVINLALSRENLKLSQGASWALYQAGEALEVTDVARITFDQLATRASAVAVPMAMALGRAGSNDYVIDVAKRLSTHTSRKALLISLMMAAAPRDADLADDVGKLLPETLSAAICAAIGGAPKLRRNALDDLGDVRVVAEVIRCLDFLFEPKKTR
jgi:hypothetical protein